MRSGIHRDTPHCGYTPTGMPDHEILSGLIRLHVLYHASREGLFGLGMIHELRNHGYKIGPGTLYPLLHRMEEKGYLRSASWRASSGGGTPRRRADGGRCSKLGIALKSCSERSFTMRRPTPTVARRRHVNRRARRFRAPI